MIDIVKEPRWTKAADDRRTVNRDRVRELLQEIEQRGDSAVAELTERFDNVKLEPGSFEISSEEMERAHYESNTDHQYLAEAAENIRLFAERQLQSVEEFSYVTTDNVEVGQRIQHIETVGVYVPGGAYPLVSTALMTIIPAKVARVENVVMCSPPSDKGSIYSSTLVAADMAGADKIFTIGGVQAIGAMTYGTSTVPSVDKIVGPGNKFVTAAKKEVYGTVGIDGLAGPSEILVIADAAADPGYVASDLIAQAEHDPDAKVALVTPSREFANAVQAECKEQVSSLSTKETAMQALHNGFILVVDAIEEAIAFCNDVAPEHVSLQGGAADASEELCNYGSLFIGDETSVVFGDYGSGPNHVLPTNGSARYADGLSVLDFLKVNTWQRIDDASDALVTTAAELGEREGLDGHARAARLRGREEMG